MISFVAYGTPAPKGSTKAFYRPGMRFPVVTEDNKHTRPWAAIVKDAALREILDRLGFGLRLPFPEGPVSLSVVFYMPRPKSLPKRVVDHTKKPDLDKLLRAIKDALTGVVWQDDSQVVEISAFKVYAYADAMPRAIIKVQRYSESARLFPAGVPAADRGSLSMHPMEVI